MSPVFPVFVNEIGFFLRRVDMDIILTPVGCLRICPEEKDAREKPYGWIKKVSDAFACSQSAGLFALAATRPDAPLSPSFSYWREFAARYLTDLCRTPESAGRNLEPIAPPTDAEKATLLISAPPMQGAEYLNVGVLQELWADLDGWVRKEVSASSDGLGEWLKKHAPLWHQVGRVCFHLAENKRDPEFPFAF